MSFLSLIIFLYLDFKFPFILQVVFEHKRGFCVSPITEFNRVQEKLG